MTGGRHRRVAHLVALATLVAVAAAATAYDVVQISTQQRTQHSLQETRVDLRHTRSTLTTTTGALSSTTATLSARRTAQTRTASEIASVTQSLAGTSQDSGLQTVDIATLRSCLSGVSTAVSAAKSADLPGVVSSITGASSACLALDGSSTTPGTGPSYPFDFPDPYVMNVGNEYYAFATNSAAGNIQVIESADLVHWTTLGDALPHLAQWAQPGAVWGPSVLQVGATYVLYYSAIFGSSGDQCISEAVATQPQGPYVDSSTWPIVCQTDLGGSLDPSPYVSAAGTPYLTWKSQGGTGQPPALWAQQMTPTGTLLVPGPPASLLKPDEAWQGGIVEGPDMVLAGSQYLLFYSANNWTTAAYGIGVAACRGPMGPCTDESTQPLLASQSAFSGPGGPTVFTDSSGSPWIAFHAWLPGEVGFPNSRVLFLRRISVSGTTVTIGP